MSYQFSIWLDEKTAKDLDALSCFEERKRGAMIKVLIRREAKKLHPHGDPTHGDGLPMQSAARETKPSKGGINAN